jgi:hypothetical protein
VQSDADTVEDYLESLPEDRRRAIGALRETIASHLPEGYVEVMQYGMIGWVVPLERYPDTYNGQPLSLAALASQKKHMSLYLMCVYGDEDAEKRFRQAWMGTGHKLDMGKSCVRFKRLEDVPLDVVAETIAGTSVDDLIAAYERSRR